MANVKIYSTEGNANETTTNSEYGVSMSPDTPVEATEDWCIIDLCGCCSCCCCSGGGSAQIKSEKDIIL